MVRGGGHKDFLVHLKVQLKDDDKRLELKGINYVGGGEFDDKRCVLNLCAVYVWAGLKFLM